MKEIINFNSKIEPLEQVNPLITKYRINICQPDIPANRYIFSKEVIEGMFSTIRGSGVYAYYFDKDKQFGGHSDDVVKTKYGYKRTGEPIAYGFSDPYKDPYWLEIKNELWCCSDVYLWTGRNPEIEEVMQSPVWQSMEVAVDAEEDKQGNKLVKEAIFLGFCLLQGIDPAFSGSKITKFTLSYDDNQVNKLKQEFETFISKYDHIDFTIPTNIKESTKFGLELYKKYNIGGTSLSLANARFIQKNDKITPEKVKRMCKYCTQLMNKEFSKDDESDSNWIAFNLWGSEEGYKWSSKLTSEIKKRDEERLSYFVNETNMFKNKEEKESIDIDNSKDSSVSSKWEDPGKTLYEPILEASNKESLINEAYLEHEKGYEDSPSTKLKYPHHVIKDDKMVVHFRGVQAAFSRAKQQGLSGEPINHIKKHYKELGLNMDNFSEFDLTEEEYSTYFKEDGENVIKDIEKFGLTSGQVEEILNNALSEYKYKNGDYECHKYWVRDHDEELVFVRDYEDDKLYSFKYIIADKVATIDMESKDEVINAGYESVNKNPTELSDKEDEDVEMAKKVKDEEKSDSEDEKPEDNKEDNNEEEKKETDLSSNVNVDNNAMQELNENSAKNNKELAEKQLEVEDDKDKIIAGLKEELSALKEQLSKSEEDKAVCMKKNEELKEFKDKIDKDNKTFAIETTLKEVEKDIPKEELEQLRMSAETYSLENINIWQNEVRAKGYQFSKGLTKKDPYIKIALPNTDKPQKRGTGLWDSL